MTNELRTYKKELVEGMESISNFEVILPSPGHTYARVVYNNLGIMQEICTVYSTTIGDRVYEGIDIARYIACALNEYHNQVRAKKQEE